MLATLLRGSVETNFRFLKSNFKFDKLNSKKINSIKQNLYTCQFLFIIESLINYITPDESIKLNDIVSNIIPKDNDINLKKPNINNKDNNETINKDNNESINKNNSETINKNNKQKKSTNKSLSFNLIGNHLLKSVFITKIKKKEK